MNIYETRVVHSLRNTYQPILQDIVVFNNLKKRLLAMANSLCEAYQKGEESPCILLNNYHPSFIGKSISELHVQKLELETFKQAVAYEHGFIGWQQVSEQLLNPFFEDAVDTLLAGDVVRLGIMLKEHPTLVHEVSAFGHQASLLNYCAANGVELWRQRIPMNLEEVIRLLLDNGADSTQKMKVYGGEFDTLSLLETSAHPWEAGIDKNILDLLR